ncbi:MAG: winged helix-turn-helix domain-containing protein [Polyangiales bacterium]
MTALHPTTAAPSFAFGPFLLTPAQQRLQENGQNVRVGRRAFELLTALVERGGQVVGKEELMARAWPGLVVDEGNLKVTIAALRRLLGEGSGPPRYIATVVGRGYRFVAGVRVSAHPQVVASTRVGNLPSSSRRIHGREDALASLVEALETTRLISIVGPGGVGKTTLAVALADRVARAFAGGAWLVDLAAVSEASRVSAAIADVLRAGDTDADALGDRELLLVLDNCEHLIDAIAQCTDRILCSSKKIKLVATSREPLCVRGERVRRLSGLALPPAQGALRAEDALLYPAVQLFVERATEKLPSFRLDDANAADVVAICRQLDGLALAIERVAPRVGTLGVAGLREHLDRRFHMFDGYHEGPARHRTLTAAVDASYVLLSASEQTTLRRLSSLEGTFSLQTACELANREGIDRLTVIEDIASLVTKSLLLAEPCDGEMHYRLPQVTRAFALEKCAAP